MLAQRKLKILSGITLFFLGLSFLVALPLAGAKGQKALGVKLTDKELDAIRGGYLGGFSFGIYFSGSWDSTGKPVVQGSFTTGTGTSPSLSPGSTGTTISGSAGTIQAYVGNFQGASGMFQIIQSPGSYNILNNNILFEVTIINVANESALRSVQSMLSWR